MSVFLYMTEGETRRQRTRNLKGEEYMAMPPEQIKSFILEAFPDAILELKDLVGDNDHFEATITTKAFRGKTRIQQHQMVYDALQGHMGTQLHALSLKTHIPQE